MPTFSQCHPTKLNHARGVCNTCYKKQRRNDFREHERELDRIRYALAPFKKNISNRDYRIKLKEDMFEHYGYECACCGELEIEFLEFDHINNDGNVARKGNSKNVSGWQVWKELKDAGFPPVIQVLCADCHRSKTRHGQCIHKLRGMCGDWREEINEAMAA